MSVVLTITVASIYVDERGRIEISGSQILEEYCKSYEDEAQARGDPINWFEPNMRIVSSQITA